MQKEYKKPLPYNYYYYPVILLVILGLADTTYLAVSHYRNYTDITYSSFCALSKAINCDTVSQSPWSILFGLPVALWGALGYFVYGLLLILVRKNTPAQTPLWNLLFILGLLLSSASVWFGYISASKIHSYCIMCIFSYTINFILLLYAWIICRRFNKTSPLLETIKACKALAKNTMIQVASLCLIVTLVGLIYFIPHYWTFTFPEASSNIPSGLTKEWHPWIGSEDPLVTIEEYSDYQCFQCNKMHFLLRRMVAEHPEKIRLIHHHFPMDHTVNEIIVPTPFHIGSGKMALLAIYAASQDKFWQMNDLLFALGQSKEPFNTKTLAEKTELSAGALSRATNTSGSKVRLFLQNEIRQAMKLGITGTPSFVINDKVYTGSIPVEILEDILK
jgi:protein-disulfide isomerase/uncharacterized membrane protein